MNTPPLQTTFAPIAALLLLGAIWGASFVFIKLGLESYAPATIVALRIAGSALVLLVVLRQRGLALPHSRVAWGNLLIVSLISMVLPFLLITWGEQYIPSSLAAILISTTPIFTLLLALLWTHQERLSLVRSLGVGLGFLGVITAVGIQDFNLTSASTQGELAVLGAAACYAIGGIYARRAFRGIPALVSATGTMLTGALAITPLALLLDGLPTLAPTSAALIGILGLTFLSTAIAYILYYWILEHTGAARTAMVTYLVPIFALLYGWLWLHETIRLTTLLGLALVLTGIMVANGLLRWKRRPTPPQPHLNNPGLTTDEHR